MSVEALSYLDIYAWCTLNGLAMTPFELQTIKRIDSRFVANCNERTE